MVTRGSEAGPGRPEDEGAGVYEERIQGRATMASSIANLCNTIIGTGMLATPGAFKYTGLLPGIFLIILCGFTAMAGLLFLTLCADTLGGRKNSFFSIAMHTLPKGARVFDAAIAVKVSASLWRKRSTTQSHASVLLLLVLWCINIVPHHLRSTYASSGYFLCKGFRQT